MILRGNLRELPRKSSLSLKAPLLLKARLISIVFLLVFSMVAVFFAITQETEDEGNRDHGDLVSDLIAMEEEEEAIEPEFIPTGPPRWFRSNAGGMALEEIPSRLGAIRNKYALVVDYIAPDELDPRLSPFYKKDYIIEIRVLYKERVETRRQWLLRDEAGNTKVNAVFRTPEGEGEVLPDEPGDEFAEAVLEETAAPEVFETNTGIAEASPNGDAAPANDDSVDEEFEQQDALELAAEDAPANEVSPSKKGAPSSSSAPKEPGGFIEVFNDKGQIEKDYSLFEDGSELLTEYFYKDNVLIRAETKTKDFEDIEYKKTHTDNYKYNRSYSLRNVERVFHAASNLEPVRLVFPGRVLEAAYEKDFIKEKLTLTSDFLGGNFVDDGYRMVYDTDSRGRVLGQTLFNSKDEVVWKIKNTWVGDRIAAIVKTEGDDERRTEYDYNSAGDRVAQRDIMNGALERQVLINGSKETEELYLNGIIVLRAFWEDGRKISEERIRRR
jgi:YD repeat-containing protein